MSSITRCIVSSCFLFCAVIAAVCQSSPEQEAVNQARELYRQHKYKDSLKLLKDTLKKYPDCSTCYAEISSYEEGWGHSREAIDAADHAVKVARDDMLRARARLYRCQLLSVSGDKKELATAEQDCRAVVQFAPGTADAHLNLGLVLLRENREVDGLPEIKTYVENWPSARDISYAKKVLANPRLARESVAPDFAIACAGGKTISSSELAGKVVVLDFWATWCGPCRKALPEMKELVSKYQDRLVVISASADEDENAWRDFIANNQMIWPQFFDKDESLRLKFGVHSFPTYILIDGDGVIRKRIVGTDPQQSLAFQLKSELKKVLEPEDAR